MPLLTCSQVSDVSCRLVTPEAHECTSVACAGESDSAVTPVKLSTINALSVASTAMPIKAKV